MDADRLDARKDLMALLSALFFVLGAGIGICLLVFYTVGPLLLGPLDQPVGSPALAIAFIAALLLLLAAGCFIGGALWLIVMSRVLPKPTLHKWLTYGPQIPALLRLNLRLLDSLYSKNESAL